ncbi:S-methyl-5'-thioadenosine phosphorylase [Candidatus Magnetominusculus xianensis]|uniref:Probable 6-oxopurine nucleoside phosphorylase n=1 Tax=Candidatus Magnetominusculus xianensis TaxID=1748249 RepID=A0ABR5SBJ2_9BACT|nr:S-methyl-5'-thioadenosine phosphorylase [Candidatus Magnetominusculus xianensis]KWT78144.1 5'-methylthioadenosine phosphorylase [Candidatus Magnetominusculus xianensis]MBF0403962.1 S-methyl-5'-thioadenosine phosphorylase [Nitrospirota bacterium]
MPEIGIIGGSGVYRMSSVELVKNVAVDTPYGAPSDAYKILMISGVEAVFLARHGGGHTISPHKVNYRANIWGFKALGVKRLLSLGAVGGINPVLKPGSIVVADQIIDMTTGRVSTFYDKDEVYHIDFSEPFCPELRSAFIEAAGVINLPVLTRGAYICTNGPRFETRAEIRYYSTIGADMVGMTAMPEAVLARESEICYGTIATVTNHAAGISTEKLTTTEVIETVNKSSANLNALLLKTIPLIKPERACPCKDALKDAKI